MYLNHFGLSTNPFGISPRLDFLYKSGAFEEGMAHLVYGLDKSEAVVMITGPIGTGKTMAIQSFLSALGDRYVSALVTNTSVDGRELLKLILEDLDLAQPSDADKSDLLIAFKHFLIATSRQGKRVVIVIDEAQNLSREVLEEVRLLTNLGQGQEQPVQIILVGQPELESTIERQDLAQLRQRIRVHCRLAPLDRRELEEYINHRMRVAGGAASCFSGAALDGIFRKSGGVPRVVNTLCDRALLSAFVAGRKRVDVADLDDDAGSVAPEVDKPSQGEEPPRASRTVATERAPAMAVRRESAEEENSRHRETAGRTAGAGMRPLAVILLVVTILAVLVAAWRWPEWRKAVIASPDLPRNEAPSEVRAAVKGTDLREPDMAADVAGDTLKSQPIGVPDSSAATVSGVAPQQHVNEKAPAPPVVTVSSAPADGVPVAAPVQKASPVGSSSGEDSGKPCYLHVSSFRTSEHAEAVAGDYGQRGLPAIVRSQTVSGVLWYRVYLGPFSDHDAAVRRANELRDAGTITYYKVASLEPDAGS